MKKQNINLYLASPRGFCAGVDRAVKIVEETIKKFGSPVYVRHEIVHNKRVVEDLIKKGAIFVEELNEVPKGAKVIFSAHGVAKEIKEQAKKFNHLTIDATCPLVSKVHKQTENYSKKGYKVILIGHRGHPEVIGIQGQIKNEIIIIQNENEDQNLILKKDINLAYVTQTTLSIDDTKNIITILKRKFPSIIGPELEDICYATQNRQVAVNKLADNSDLVLVIGGENSSNTQRLAEIVQKKNIPVYRISCAEEIQKNWLNDKKNIGITAGASSPEVLITEVINYLKDTLKNVKIIQVEGVKENITFKPLESFT